MKTYGIDLGTRNIKIAEFSNNEFQFRIFDTVDFYKNYIISKEGSFEIDLQKLHINGQICATGYGREMANLTGIRKISEIMAHTKGTIWQTGLSDFILIDLGGQDSKIIDIENYNVQDFRTNDRCAASTGRYLENMANILGMSIDEISKYHRNPEKLSSICAVFGESELLSKIAMGSSIESLASGVNHALVNRLKPFIASFMSKTIVLTGGVSKSEAIQKIIEENFQTDLIIPQFPQFNGAIGAIADIIDIDITKSII
ncbi:MAG: acyl-CoA dehydratase activase [Candidatus Zixiibacteriota bacterium]